MAANPKKTAAGIVLVVALIVLGVLYGMNFNAANAAITSAFNVSKDAIASNWQVFVGGVGVGTGVGVVIGLIIKSLCSKRKSQTDPLIKSWDTLD